MNKGTPFAVCFVYDTQEKKDIYLLFMEPHPHEDLVLFKT